MSDSTVVAWPYLIGVVAVSAWIVLGHERRVRRWREKQSRLAPNVPPAPMSTPTVAETEARWLTDAPAPAATAGVAPSIVSLSARVDAIEAEVDRLWPDLDAPSAPAVAEGGAFGAGTMAFAQWLRHVFIPSARARIADGTVPATSSVAAYAVREFAAPDTEALIELLSRFDAAVGRGER